MRFLFSTVPAFGHALPLVPLVRAAVERGHSVGLVTAADMAEDLRPEITPAVDFLGAGATPLQLFEEVGHRTGADVLHPTPEVIGETFGGTRLDLGGADAVDLIREWHPDVIVSEAYDTVGPFAAAHLHVPWHQLGIGPAVPDIIVREIDRSAARVFAAAGVNPTRPGSYIDTCPSLLQDPDWSSTVPVYPQQTRAHRRFVDAPFETPTYSDPSLPTVLVTLGTVFSDRDVLTSIVDAVRRTGVNVLAALGSSIMGLDSAASVANTAVDGDGGGEVRYVPFVPLDQLLDSVDLVLGAGGAGTVLGSLARALPMVLWPQGADQPSNAARAADGGVAITVAGAEEIPAAVEAVLADGSYRLRAAEAAQENASKPTPIQVLAHLERTAASR